MRREKARTFKCRACGSSSLAPILDLGKTPLANALLRADELDLTEKKYPLKLVFCPKCTLVQITETVPPEELFRDYPYLSSYSDTMLKHAQELAAGMMRSWRLGADSLVIEIGSNDGYLLQYYREKDVPVLGIDPAQNIARVAEERGIPTLADFFGPELAKRLKREGRCADVIHANNVLAHVADLNGFVAGLATALKADGVAVIEVPYVKDMIDNCEFDTIYHEHLCYFSLTALERLFRRHGLAIVGVERVAIHGGTLQIHTGKTSAHAPAGVREFLAREAEAGLDREPYYRNFAERVAALREELVGRLRELKRAGKRIAAYGASAKGSTLLNHFGIGSDLLQFVADRSPVKQGRLTPGTHLRIVAPEELAKQMPDYVLLLTWNFADEILEQQAEYRKRGGRFVIPVPEVRIV